MLVAITVVVSELLVAIDCHKIQLEVADITELESDSNHLIKFLDRINDGVLCNEFEVIHNSNNYSENLKCFAHEVIFRGQFLPLAKKWQLLELEIHNQNISNFHFCLKRNLGTNETTKGLLKLLSPPSIMAKIGQQLNLSKKLKDIVLRENLPLVKCRTFMFGVVTGIFSIVSYIIDFVKDAVFALILKDKGPMLQTSF
jgi:hypothetical protein